jgi:NAD(P)H-hydrate repair Nnr-like enzyme with NAD(P)H-hydrate dehydratase domain
LAFVVTVEIDIDAPSKELERLIGKWDSEEEKFEKTIAFSLHYDVIVVMKGAPTHIIDAEKCTGILQEMRLWPQPEAGMF